MEKKNNHILLAGVDTLEVGFCVEEFCLTPEEWEQLATAKYNAQGTMFGGGGTPIELRRRKFAVSPKGGKGYEYILVNDDVTIQIAERAQSGDVYPEIHVTWRSQYLWRHGWRASYQNVRDWLDNWAVISGEKVSRADLNVDLNCALPSIDLRGNEVVTYARSKQEFFIQHHLKGLEETGFSFGQGKLRCRIYDKLAEIEHSSKAWFGNLWEKQGWDGQSPVTRVEFQARRDFLRSMQVETVADLERQLADLWRYFVAWVSLRDKSNDSNRRRWPLKEFWRVVVAALPAFGVVTGVMRLTQRKPKVDALERFGRGVMVTLAALTATRTGFTSQAAIGYVLERARDWVAQDSFRNDVECRASRFAFMEKTVLSRALNTS